MWDPRVLYKYVADKLGEHAENAYTLPFNELADLTFILLLMGGIPRQGEAAELKWENFTIDQEKNEILVRFVDTKGPRPSYRDVWYVDELFLCLIPIYKRRAQREILEWYKKANKPLKDCPWVFITTSPYHNKKKSGPRKLEKPTLRNRVLRVMSAAGIPTKFSKELPANSQTFGVHSIRAAVVTMLVKCGVDPLQAMWFGGWTSMAVFRMYYNKGTSLSAVSQTLTKTFEESVKDFAEQVVLVNAAPEMSDEEDFISQNIEIPATVLSETVSREAGTAFLQAAAKRSYTPTGHSVRESVSQNYRAWLN